MNHDMQDILFVHSFLNEGKTDSSCIKSCIEYAVSSREKRIIVFDQKDWFIDEAILLPSNTTIVIDGCMIKQNDYVFDNIFRGDNILVDPSNPLDTPLGVSDISNIRIIGKNGATIVGCDRNREGFHPVLNQTQEMTGDFWGWRTLQISLSRCHNFEICGIELLQTRCWAMSFDFCSEGYIHDVHIVSNVKNGDGIDFRIGCHHCKVQNITGYTSDDTVACTALYSENLTYPHKNYLYPLEPAQLLWNGTDIHEMDIHNICISGIYTGGNHHGVICLAAGGLQVYNITVENICEDASGQREATVKLYTGYGSGYRQNDIHDIVVDRVVSKIADYAVLCNAKVGNVILSNISQQNETKEKFRFEDDKGITVAK